MYLGLTRVWGDFIYGSPIFLKIRNMKKDFYTYDEQMKKLKTDGLIITDPDEVLSSLKNIGYYKLIKGYNALFVHRYNTDNNESKHQYNKNVRFEDIKALYDFDFELRNIIYKRVSSIEIMIKSLVSYEFSKNHGIDHNEYLKAECFNSNQRNSDGIVKLIEKCREVISESSKEGSGSYRRYIAYPFEQYKQVPVWSLFMALTFGSVSKFYQFMKDDEKTAIATLFNVNSSELENILKIIVKFRNIVFHHERLFDATLYKERLSQKLRVVKSLSIPKTPAGENKYGLNDFLSLLISLKYLLSKLEFASLIEEIELAFESLAKKTCEMYVKEVKAKMRIAKTNLKTLVKIRI